MRKKSVLSLLAPAALLLQVSAASAAICGDAQFNFDVNWPGGPALYYTVTGAPPNTCGYLYANRNGAGYVGSGGYWICTDSNGNATKGPWSSNPDDETAFVFIDWVTCTSPVRKHIWDVGAPSATINAGYPSGFSGTATDEAWGAGFSSTWSTCSVEYRKLPTGLSSSRWWDRSTGGYTSLSALFYPCSLSGMPSLNVNWSTTATNRPDLADHVSGDSYTWRVWVWDGGQWGIKDASFVY